MKNIHSENRAAGAAGERGGNFSPAPKGGGNFSPAPRGSYVCVGDNLSPFPYPRPAFPLSRVKFRLGRISQSWSALMTYLSDFSKAPLAFACCPDAGLKAFCQTP